MKKEGGEQMKRDFAVAVKAIIIREEKALILHRSPQEIESSYMKNGICLEEAFTILNILQKG